MAERLRATGERYWRTAGQVAIRWALGFALVLALRALGRTFVSLYIVSDPSLAILSLFQAIAFQAWLDSRERSQSGDPAQ